MIVSTLILTFCDPLSVWTAPCEDMGHHEPEHPPCDWDRRLRQGCQLSLLLQAGKKIMNIEYKPVSNAVHRCPCGSRDIWIFQWYLKSYWYLRSISTFDTILYIRFTDLVCSDDRDVSSFSFFFYSIFIWRNAHGCMLINNQ